MYNHGQKRGMDMKKDLRMAFRSTIPVLTGYLTLGFGFGVLLRTKGFSWLWALGMSGAIYAGSMQYVALDLMTGGVSLITVALTTLMVNARHLFYGISMVDKYKGTGIKKPYLIFGLTDETYSLVCGNLPEGVENRSRYYLLVSFMNQCYWITGSVIGALFGGIIHFNVEGIDFALTALFVTIFTDQWLTNKDHIYALVGVGSAVLCLLIFGAENFLIPSMILITILLAVLQKVRKGDKEHG